LGHRNLNGDFVPGAITDFLVKAAGDLSHPYFLCLDEMNLARVEYYFSDLLSVMETRNLRNGQIVTDPFQWTVMQGG
jgi:5-methylcytosine-specific restriction enzyme B